MALRLWRITRQLSAPDDESHRDEPLATVDGYRRKAEVDDDQGQELPALTPDVGVVGHLRIIVPEAPGGGKGRPRTASRTVQDRNLSGSLGARPGGGRRGFAWEIFPAKVKTRKIQTVFWKNAQNRFWGFRIFSQSAMAPWSIKR